MLRRVISASVAILAAAAMAPAPASSQTPPLVTSQSAYNWSGFYFGGFGGVAWTEIVVPDLFTDDSGGVFYMPGGNTFSFSPEGLFGGAQTGYDWQWSGFVAGVVGEVGFMDLQESITNPFALPVPLPEELPVTSFKGDWFGSATARVGVPFDRLLIFARGGVAFLHGEGSTVDTCARSFCGQTTIDASGDDILWGWTIGGGAEVAVTERVRVGAEYRFYDFEPLKVSGIANNVLEYHQDVDVDGLHTARVFVNFVW